MLLNWQKCEGGSWGSLLRVDLSHPYFDSMNGVYIMWHAGENPQTTWKKALFREITL